MKGNEEIFKFPFSFFQLFIFNILSKIEKNKILIFGKIKMNEDE